MRTKEETIQDIQKTLDSYKTNELNTKPLVQLLKESSSWLEQKVQK